MVGITVGGAVDRLNRIHTGWSTANGLYWTILFCPAAIPLLAISMSTWAREPCGNEFERAALTELMTGVCYPLSTVSGACEIIDLMEDGRFALGIRERDLL